MVKEIGVEKMEIMIPTEIKEEVEEMIDVMHSLPKEELKYFLNFVQGMNFAITLNKEM